MKKQWTSLRFTKHGTAEQLTTLFGTAGTDVLTGPDGSVVVTGDGSIDACAQVGGNCL